MKPIVIKIGGSTFGKSDTTVEDLVTLQKRGIPTVVVHGGANTVTNWLGRLNIPTSFVRGLRVTDIETLKVVTAILAGLVNKELVADIWSLGGKAVGLSGADGELIKAKNRTTELGYTGEHLQVNTSLLKILLNAGYMPVIAPISLGKLEGSNSNVNILNVNGDTAAGAIAASLGAERLIFLTDVPGICDSTKQLVRELTADGARELIASGVATGGMDAKVEACLVAVDKVAVTRIIDGRKPHALINEIDGKADGTTITR
ncbi:MAG: acetylglutamate kinase [Chloroflexi bacterium]|nr:acetylglutamate kinase [Chloroflexota bacterium]MBM3174223.1 acetylglutamate kinase [Chloroflexota bacterium]MBM4449884.1 acetylglutamate kinase [Chloroflexota bacterium]